VSEFLDAYLSGELPWIQRWVFKAHIAMCRNCRNYIAGYREAMKLSKKAFAGREEAVPEELVKAVLRAQGR
jgi:predicted anti-sigma-YlaC factor YlaD